MSAFKQLAKIRLTLTSCLFGASMIGVSAGIALGAAQTSAGRLNHLAAARALLSALYPELPGKNLILSYSGSFSFDGSGDPQPNMLDITVSPFPANHHPTIAGVIRQDPSQPAAPARTELGAFVWFGRGGYVYRFAAKSDKILNTS